MATQEAVSFSLFSGGAFVVGLGACEPGQTLPPSRPGRSHRGFCPREGQHGLLPVPSQGDRRGAATQEKPAGQACGCTQPGGSWVPPPVRTAETSNTAGASVRGVTRGQPQPPGAVPRDRLPRTATDTDGAGGEGPAQSVPARTVGWGWGGGSLSPPGASLRTTSTPKQNHRPLSVCATGTPAT